MSLTPLPPWRSVLAVVAHPDHAHATAAAVHVADTLDLPVLGWTVPDTVAATLREEHRAPFHGHAVNGPAYGADETFNAVRLAAALSSAGCDRGCSDFSEDP